MKIIDKRQLNALDFKDIGIGDIFEFTNAQNKTYRYLKISNADSSYHNAFCLDTKTTTWFDEDAMSYPLEATLTIN